MAATTATTTVAIAAAATITTTQCNKNITKMDMNEIRKRLPEFKKGAKKGDRECLYWLGYFHYHGHKDIVTNWTKAVKYLKQSAEQGSGKAAHMVGFCYKKGKGTPKNNQKAQYWFERAIGPLMKEADNGDIESVKMLGHAYHTGSGVQEDPERGVQLLQHAADNGNLVAMNYVAGCYEIGDGVEKDLDEAFALYQQAAAEGNPLSQDELGHWYLDGENVERNVDRAIELFEKAMENGSLYAKCSLATCYEEGNGVEKDIEKAIQLYTEAAEAGFAGAFRDLGYLYRNELGEEKDLKMAVNFFREAVRRGHTCGDAEQNLAYSYENGLGVKENPRMAVKWYHRSIEAGNKEDAGHALESLIEELKTRAYQQDKNALKALAYCYRNGVGVSQIPEVATALLHPYQSTAGTNKNAHSKEDLNQIQSSGSAQKKCVCCEDRFSSAVLVHGGTGHACFCLPCALSCGASAEDDDDSDDDSAANSSYCPICRASIDKVILLLPIFAEGKHQKCGQDPSCCVSCGKNESNATILHGGTGHSCSCYECACEAKKQGKGCPICFESIDDVIKSYCM